MRVLQVYRDYFTILPGGIERHVYELAHNMQDLGSMEVLVSGRQRRSRTIEDGPVRVHLAGEWGRIQGVPLCPSFPRTVRKGRYDVVHFHSPNPTGELAARLAGSSTARVATYHADTERGRRVSGLLNGFMYSMLAACDRVIASSEQLVGASPVLSRLRDNQPESIRIIPFGVDVDRFSPGPGTMRALWGPRPVVLFLGRLRYYKGLDYLIEAMRSLDATLVVAGNGLEADRIVTMGRQVLEDRFVWLGDVADDQVPDIYRSADVFCLPSSSKAEAFGIAAMEALASGLPVITTEVGTATSTVTADGLTGFVVPPRDSEPLRSAIDKVLSGDDLRARMGAASRERALEMFDRRIMFERIAEVYREAIAQR